MADSKSINPIDDITNCFFHNLSAQVQPGDHLVVALSGGMDSVVLLHLLATLSKSMQLDVSAVHVEHGISAHSSQWSTFCQTLCDSLAIPLSTHRLKICKQPQKSLEALAREARYQIFRQIQADYVVLAQHQDDQVETLMLQLLRGAGIKGLSAMPTVRLFAPGKTIRLLRPLLNIPRSKIQKYAKFQKLSWVTDESNLDTSYDRNFLRHQILPLLEQRYPAYRKTLFRSTRHLGEAAHLLDELAKIDAQNTMIVDKLSLRGLRELDHARAGNLLRHLLAQRMTQLPSAVKLEEILCQLYNIQADNRFHFVVDTLEIRCHRGLIEFLPADALPKSILPVVWQGEQRLAIGSSKGVLEFTRQNNVGIHLAKLDQQIITIRSRSGGERFQPDCKRPRRSLKKILQEASLPPWKRNILPLLFCGDQLVWVAEIGIDCHFQTPKESTGLVVTWHSEQTDQSSAH
ncbi:tRNA lysidine(34) synthetase TilS [Nitrosomonas sp. HPC101]|uniref:tRNA lysidine(34) synthetase TilS n=1 Tax=Nitrosomonas sp. HPC101 TaxID=1658667 RepID=UPI0013707622|nr:tRNA lysidine(34) synthetase TilS [Nitrosomonas sp. HPC101]MXS84860.1 tRNA lysidine(34) synthetase TilS [Nitrosomonas sp. HPC101]